VLRTIFILLTVANFLYAALHGHDWQSAVERTYFQGTALIFVWLAPFVMRFNNYLKNVDKPTEEWTPPKGPFREPKRGDPDFIDTIDG
jgi:hypothetical protein